MSIAVSNKTAVEIYNDIVELIEKDINTKRFQCPTQLFAKRMEFAKRDCDEAMEFYKTVKCFYAFVDVLTAFTDDELLQHKETVVVNAYRFAHAALDEYSRRYHMMVTDASYKNRDGIARRAEFKREFENFCYYAKNLIIFVSLIHKDLVIREVLKTIKTWYI